MKKGFTIIELLVVIAIVGILSAIVLSAVSSERIGTPGNTTGTNSSLQSTEVQGQNIPLPTDYVNDRVGVLNEATILATNEKLSVFSSSGKGEIAVLIVESLNGLSIEEYGIRVGEAWKVGKYGQDNGNILIISTGDRKVRIETGSGSSITDSQAAQILADSVVPFLKKGDWNGGVVSGVEAIIKAMN